MIVKWRISLLQRLNDHYLSPEHDGLHQLLLQRTDVEHLLYSQSGAVRHIFFILSVHNALYTMKKESIQEEESHNQFPVDLTNAAQQYCDDNAFNVYTNKLFVGNVSYRVKQHELWDFFELFGKVLRVNILKDRKTRKSRGIAFVVFASSFEAIAAINASSEQLSLDGRVLKVSWAKKKRDGRCYGELNQERIKEAVSTFLDSEDSKSKDCAISVLNDDLMIAIFGFLDLVSRVRVELVCKRWQLLALQSWADVRHLHFNGVFQHLSGFGAGLIDPVLWSLLRKGCEHLKHLDLSGSPYMLSSSSLIRIGDVCKSLEVLNLNKVPIRTSTLKELGSRLLHLKELHLASCLNVGEKGLWWMLKDTAKLECLTFTDNPKLQGKCLYMLHDRMRSIILTNCSMLNDHGLVNMATKSPNLIEVDLSFCPSITDAGLRQLFQGCKQIQKFLMKGTPVLGSTNGLQYLSNLSNLETLCLAENKYVADETIATLISYCPKLRDLDIQACHGNITSEGIRSLSRCTCLTSLCISYILEVSDDCVSAIAFEGRLTSFTARACTQLSNLAVNRLLQHNDLLEVDVSSCFLVDDLLVENMRTRRMRTCDEQYPSIHIVLGGTSVTEDGVEKLRDLLAPCTVSMQSRSNRMLRNDLDPTFIGSFFASDEEDDDGVDEEEEEEAVDDNVEEEASQPDENQNVSTGDSFATAIGNPSAVPSFSSSPEESFGEVSVASTSIQRGFAPDLKDSASNCTDQSARTCTNQNASNCTNQNAPMCTNQSASNCTDYDSNQNVPVHGEEPFTCAASDRPTDDLPIGLQDESIENWDDEIDSASDDRPGWTMSGDSLEWMGRPRRMDCQFDVDEDDVDDEERDVLSGWHPVDDELYQLS